MNPSTAAATVILDELIRGGVRDLVLCPGSRSAPFAYAAHAAESAGRLRVHVRVDERSAGFLAIGLILGTRGARPVAVVTTSGTAVANLHPAVLEAHHSGWPLVVLSADRPHELRGTGANQTTPLQPGLFGAAVRHAADLPAVTAGEVAGAAASWRSTVCRALDAADGERGLRQPGPVQLNVCFRDPLVPDLVGDEPAPPDLVPSDAQAAGPALTGRAEGAAWVERASSACLLDTRPDLVEAVRLDEVERTVVVVGGGLGPVAAAGEAVRWAQLRGYPCVAEPFGSMDRRTGSGQVLMPHGPLLLTCGDWVDAHAPERVIVIGRPTLSRPVATLLRRPGVRVEAVAEGAWSDPGHVVSRVHPWCAITAEMPGLHGGGGAAPDAGGPEETADRSALSQFATAWASAGQRVADAVAAEGYPWPTGLAVAQVLGESLPGRSTLFVGASNPVRDLDLALRRQGRGREGSEADPHLGLVVMASRGLAGIDGSVSSAVGLALTEGHPTHAWLGDLTFLHDANGLLIGPGEPRPDLTIVVTNDDGGGIFATLEHGAPERVDTFERFFGTPTETDLAALCRAHGIRHLRAETREALASATAADPHGITVVEVPLDRATHRAAHARLRQVATAALQ